jgi:hypothetical protein
MGTLEQVIVSERKCVLGGIEYSIKPPTLADWSFFITYSRQQKQKELVDVYKMANEKIDIRAISDVMVGLEDAISSALQIKGLVVLVHRLIEKNKNNPKIKVEELEEILDIKDVALLSDLIVASLPVDDESKNLSPQTGNQKP